MARSGTVALCCTSLRVDELERITADPKQPKSMQLSNHAFPEHEVRQHH
jgi:hypothetical protein